MKILITGGAGYIGTELTKYLLQNKEIKEITVYDNLSIGHANFFLGKEYPKDTRLNFVNGDILDSRLLRKSLVGVDTVVHLAAKVTTPFANNDPHFYEQINHWGTAELTYAVEESNVKNLVYLSSTSVYGANHEECSENSIPSPNTYYGISKLRGEEHVSRLKSLEKNITLRCGNVYGYSKSMRFDAVINRFMFDANFKRRIQINGNGKQSRAFIHVFNVVEMIEKVITSEVASGTYNIVDKSMQILDIVDVMKDIYPDLEFIFMNQHMNLWELRVSSDSKLYDQVERFKSTDFKQEMIEFQKGFAF
ncbi:MAG: SDR family oxidoreductase [Bacteroidota bacterium]